MIVHFVRQAEQDLEDIADVIARENPARALSFMKELRMKAAAIAQAPHAFPVMQRYEHQGSGDVFTGAMPSSTASMVPR